MKTSALLFTKISVNGDIMTEAKSEKRNFSVIGFSMLLMIVLTAVLQIVCKYLLGRIPADNSWAKYLLIFIPQYCVALPAAYLLLKRLPREEITRKNLTASRFLIILLVCFAIMYAGNLIATVITAIISGITGREMSNIVEKIVSGSDIFANLIVIGIAAPVMEEFFYRKLLISRLLRYGDKAAIITSGLIFGLMHGNLSQFFYAFGLGAALGYVYVRTGKLIYTIALHMFINILGGVVGPLLIRSESLLLPFFGMMVLAMAVAGAVLFFSNKKRIWFKQGICELENWKSAAFLNPGMISFFTACAALFLANTIYAL